MQKSLLQIKLKHILQLLHMNLAQYKDFDYIYYYKSKRKTAYFLKIQVFKMFVLH